MGLHLYITSTILQENAFQNQGPPAFFSALAHGFGFLVWFTVQVQAYAIGSGTAVWCTGIWILDVRLLVAVRLRLTACRLYSICTRRIRWRFDNIGEFKIYKMSTTKTITLNQNDYNNITKSFFFYLENEKDLNLTQNEINSILQTNSKIQ